MGVTVDNVEDLQKQIAKLDRIMAKSLQRRGEIEQILFDVATGKLPPPSPQDCRVLALKLGTDKADWPEQIANHVWQGNPERDALAAQVEALQKALSDAVAAFRQYELSVDDYPTIKHKLFMQALNDELETTPQQNLAEIRAEAGRDGFVACAKWWISLCPTDRALTVGEAANQYANSIRKGEVN